MGIEQDDYISGDPELKSVFSKQRYSGVEVLEGSHIVFVALRAGGGLVDIVWGAGHSGGRALVAGGGGPLPTLLWEQRAGLGLPACGPAYDLCLVSGQGQPVRVERADRHPNELQNQLR